eukprot:CAMPEP_0117418402 /NCGR_PEP_ID=MMETSP0758-20121206/193_1 /TAXON_ID=63605 /ORGANISM="Percolomonas cosmopolitus, Strain AE-1 (ATCC 50343)" /LENGTH=743 /DNA_ID=CAMNT_0005198889 /DNA_START=157 /DNA_END=2388 /DNA_ORIENTATION=+
MEKVMAELKSLVNYWQKYDSSILNNMLAIGLSSRKNLCINKKVLKGKSGLEVDSRCRERTAHWVREKIQAKEEGQVVTDIEDLELCEYFENLENEEEPEDNMMMEDEKGEGQYNTVKYHAKVLEAGIYDLDDLKEYGKEKKFCPYFLARRAMEHANIIVYSYSYLLDPKIASLVSAELSNDSIVVFDEAHNIDSVCIESLSMNLTEGTMDQIDDNIDKLEDHYELYKSKHEDRIKAEHTRLISSFASEGIGQRTERMIANPVLPKDIMKEPVPGNMRKIEFFFIFLRRFSQFIRKDLNIENFGAREDTPKTWLKRLYEDMRVTPHELKFAAERLFSLMTTMEVRSIHDYSKLSLMADLATMLGTYDKGFTIIVEHNDYRTESIRDPKFQFACLDASIAISNVFEKFQSVILTSGTLSPLKFYENLLNFKPIVGKSFQNTLTRKCIRPMFISRGEDHALVSTKFKERDTPGVMNNYGKLLEEISKTVPDGVVCFFPSYAYMEKVISYWYDNTFFSKISENKLIYFETPDLRETSIALTNYRKACDSGRGGLFISYARGKVSEGIDFDGHYGRCCVMIGLPIMNNQSAVFKSRSIYLERNKGIKEGEFLTFDSMRTASQCLGRVIRRKNDYGLMVLADYRYHNKNYYEKLPQWIKTNREKGRTNLTVPIAISMAKAYFIEMSQKQLPSIERKLLQRLLLSKEDIERLEAESLAQDAGLETRKRKAKESLVNPRPIKILIKQEPSQ